MSLKQRGLAIAPKLAVGDGALGFWAALRECFPETREQRCWVHKTANVLNHLPKSVQPKAKADLHENWQAETRESANKAFDHFLEKYQAKYQAACDCLKKDRYSGGSAPTSPFSGPAQHSLLVTACVACGIAKAILCIEGSDGFVTSTAAPIASGWSDKLPGRSRTYWETNTLHGALNKPG